MVLTGTDVLETLGKQEVLALSKVLAGHDHVRRMKEKARIEYYSLLFDRHEIIFAEGAAVESFRLGYVAMASFESNIREQVCAIYPKLRSDPVGGLGSVAPLVAGRAEAERFVKHHSIQGLRAKQHGMIKCVRASSSPASNIVQFNGHR